MYPWIGYFDHLYEVLILSSEQDTESMLVFSKFLWLSLLQVSGT